MLFALIRFIRNDQRRAARNGRPSCICLMPLAQSRIHLLIQDPMMHRFMNAVPAAILLSLTACNASSEKTAGTAAALPDVQLPELSLATLQEVTKELSQDRDRKSTRLNSSQ